MNNLEQRVTERLERLRAEIVGNIENKGITASGRTQRSLVVEQYDGGVRLKAEQADRAPIPTLEIGRPSGKVPKRFYLILAEWSRDKDIPFATERERKTFAYFLGKRIAEEGTRRHLANEDVYSTAVQEAAKDISGIILAEVKEQIKSNI